MKPSVALTGVGLLVLAACGSPSAAVTTSPVPTSASADADLAAARAAVLAFGVPAENAVSTVPQALASAEATTDRDAQVADLAPIAAAMETFGSQIVNQTWPASAQSDVDQLESATSSLEYDYKVETPDFFERNPDEVLSEHERSFSTYDAAVRKDLGAPPPA